MHGTSWQNFVSEVSRKYQDFKTGNCRSNFARHLIENNLSIDRIENIIKVSHVIWKGGHMNSVAKYIYNETK